MSSEAVLFLGLLLVKHFLCDFPLQTPWQIQQKGQYGKLGGILHSGIHVVGTGVVLLIALRPELPVVFAVLALEFVVHYHIDWSKEQITRRMGWKNNSPFWWAIGFDQLLHQLTYLAMAAYLLG